MCRPTKGVVTRPKGVTISTLHDVSSARRVARPFIRTFLVLAIVVAWVSTNKALKMLHAVAGEWDKPFFLGISLKSTWSLCLPLWFCLRKLYDEEEVWKRQVSFHAKEALGGVYDKRGGADEYDGMAPLALNARTVLICLLMMMLVQGASVTWIISVPLTSTSANSVIYQTQCVFAYVFSICLLGEALSPSKCAAVALAQAGGEDTTSTWVGYWTVLLSAGFFALKEVIYKRYFPNSYRSPLPVTDACLCVGLIGLLSAIALVPWLTFCHFVGIERFEWPPSEVAANYFLVAVLMSLQQTFVLAGVALTSPTLITLSTILTIPLSMGWDFVLSGYLLPPAAIGGACAIVFAFLLVTNADATDALILRFRRGASGMPRTDSATCLVHSPSFNSFISFGSQGSDRSKELV